MADPLVWGLVLLGLLAVAGAIAIAARRTPSPPAEEPAPSERRPDPVPVTVGPPPTTEPPVPSTRWVPASPEDQGITRRRFLNRALTATFLLWIAALVAGVASFLWPRVRSGFGGDIDAGDATDILSRVLAADGTVTPLFVPAARAWIVPMPPEAQAGSQFEANDTVAGGLVALFQTCVHLGCRVPWCATSQGFECPCHASKYNAVGERFDGPATRNLDRFVVTIDDRNHLVVSTGQIVRTPRTQRKSVPYPVGPFCVRRPGG